MAAFLNAKQAVDRRIEREQNRIAGQKFADLEAADRDPDHDRVSAEKKKRKWFAQAPQEKEADSVPQTPPETVPVTEPIREPAETPADERPIRVRPGRTPKAPSAPEEKPAAPREEEPPEKDETPPRQEATPVAPRKEEPPKEVGTPPRQEATPIAPRRRQPEGPSAPSALPESDNVPIAPSARSEKSDLPIAPSVQPERGDVPIAPSGQQYAEEQQEILFVRGTIPKNHSVHSGPNGLIIG